MSSLPSGFIEQVRSSTELLDVVSQYVPLKRAGKNFKGLCPFHKEKTPSFNVSPDRQIFHCFGCGQGGDAFKFLMRYESMSFIEAVRHLATRAGLTIPAGGRQNPAAAGDRSLFLELHEVASRFYKSQLLEKPHGRGALEYLTKRGFSRATIEERDLGFAPDRWDALLEHLTREGYKPEDMARCGLVAPRREGRGFYDRFRKRVVIPIRNEFKKIVAFGGRILGPGEPKYLNSPESIIYRKSHILFDFDRAKETIRRQGVAILMEGYTDCIQAHQAGIDNAVACCGTSLTEGHARLLHRSTDQVVVNFDPDAAGEAATRRSIDLLIEEGFEVQVLTLAPGEDPDGFIHNRGADAFRQRLAEASSFVDYLIAQAAGHNDVGSPRGKAQFLNEVLPTLARIPNHVERVAYVTQLAERADISDAAVVEELKRKVTARVGRVDFAPEAANALKPAERDLIRWLLQSPSENTAALLAEINDDDLREMVTAPILRAIKELAAGQPATTEKVMEQLSSEGDRNLMTRIALEPSPLSSRQSPRDCLNRLREQRWRRELSRLQKKLAKDQEDDQIAAEIQALARRIETLASIEKSA